MADIKVGDTVYFSSVATLVNEGTVESIEGPYIKVNTRCPGVNYVMESEAFSTKEELKRSKSYHSAWREKQRRAAMRSSFTRMASMGVFRY